MKVETPEIRWHSGPTGLNEAVLSIDFLPRHPYVDSIAKAQEENENDDESIKVYPQVFATGGADREIKLWTVTDGTPVYIHGLSGHERSVNCVRFSPDGQYLASASDDSTVVLWMRPKHIEDDWDWSTIANNSDITRVILSCGHKGDITDVSWSPDSNYLCSVSIDNTLAIWHIGTGKLIEKRKDHSQYVQGVAWDPLSEFLVTQGNDRTCRIYTLTGYSSSNKKKKCQLIHTNRTRDINKEHDGEKPPKHILFHDDSFPAFSRRPAWTPDANYCIFPAGHFKAAEDSNSINTIYVYARGNLNLPAFHLPGHDKGVLGVRCSPILYALRETKSTLANLFQLPYRILFAVVTLTSIVVYDTQLSQPLSVIDRVHYADLTDLSWSSDGQTIIASSLDGYITFVSFKQGELGEPLPQCELPRLLERQREIMLSNQPVSKKKGKDDTPKKEKPTTETKPVTNTILQFTKVISPDVVFDQATMPIAATSPTKPSHTEGNSTPIQSKPLVHDVAVRKKRKITPVLVQSQPVATPVNEISTIDLTREDEKSKIDSRIRNRL